MSDNRDQEEMEFHNARQYVLDQLSTMTDFTGECFDEDQFEAELRDNYTFRRAMILVASEINDHDLD